MLFHSAPELATSIEGKGKKSLQCFLMQPQALTTFIKHLKNTQDSMTNVEVININFMFYIKIKSYSWSPRQHEVLLAIEMFMNGDGHYISSTSHMA